MIGTRDRYPTCPGPKPRPRGPKGWRAPGLAGGPRNGMGGTLDYAWPTGK